MTQAQLTLERLPQAVSQIQAQVDTLLQAMLSTDQPTIFLAPEKPVTTKELCKFLSITEPTCIRWRQRGKIPFMQIGGSIRYDKAAVLAAIANKKVVR
jgi:excisionase family DNA binding protein